MHREERRVADHGLDAGKAIRAGAAAVAQTSLRVMRDIHEEAEGRLAIMERQVRTMPAGSTERARAALDVTAAAENRDKMGSFIGSVTGKFRERFGYEP